MHRLPVLLIAFLLVLTACGGGDSTADGGEPAAGGDGAVTVPESGDSVPETGDESGAVGADGVSPAPLTGAVAYSFSTPFAVDLATGTATPLGPVGGQSDPTKFARGAEAAWIVVRVSDPEDANLATESLVRVDAATGELTTVTSLQEIDFGAGTSPATYGPVLPVEGAVGIVKRTDDTKTIETFDATTGEIVVSIPADEFGFVVTDGTAYYSTISGGLVRLDPLSGARTDVIAERTAFRDVAPDADLVAATSTEDAAPLSAENAEALERVIDLVEIDLENAVFADGGIWWINSRFGISFQDGTNALHEALAFYDFETSAITAYVPTGEFGARFLPADAGFDVATLSQAEIVALDSGVYVNDTPIRTGDESGAILRFDPEAATFAVFYEPDLAGADYAEVELLDTAPDGLWALVQRFTITEENADGSRSSMFETSVVQLDPATGTELGEVPLG